MAVWPGKLVVFVVVPLDMGERERERERQRGGEGGECFYVLANVPIYHITSGVHKNHVFK